MRKALWGKGHMTGDVRKPGRGVGGRRGESVPVTGNSMCKSLGKGHRNGLKGNATRGRARGTQGRGGELQGPAGPRLGLQGWWVVSRAAPGLAWTPRPLWLPGTEGCEWA